jgi:triacylglycerol lipase
MVPVVLHHGFLGHGEFQIGPMRMSYFPKIDRAITQLGHPVIVTSVHPTSSIARRAAQLKQSLLKQLQSMGLTGQKVILMAHSMGGLDARYAVTRLGLDRYVSAVVTVTSPHRGTPMADWVVENVGRRLGAFKLINFLKLDLQAVMDLTTVRCAEFNREVPDVPGVKYFSVSAARPRRMIPPFALHSHYLIENLEGENDGLVSVKSSTWGEHLGVWKADHWHTINRRFMPEFKDPTGDIAPLWVSLLQRVKAGMGLGEGQACANGSPLEKVNFQRSTLNVQLS